MRTASCSYTLFTRVLSSLGLFCYTQNLTQRGGSKYVCHSAQKWLNLRLPFTNISDFWNRWHISLSRWIKDYLYFPLGGSRIGLIGTLRNLVVTMLICGAWHGAGWTYIAWGGFHGILLAAYHLYKNKWKKQIMVFAAKVGRIYHYGSVFLTFNLVVLGWVLFRASDLKIATKLITKMLNMSDLLSDVLTSITSGHFRDLITILSLLGLCFMGPWLIATIERIAKPIPYWIKVQAACVFLILGWLLAIGNTQPFIYFQF